MTLVADFDNDQKRKLLECLFHKLLCSRFSLRTFYSNVCGVVVLLKLYLYNIEIKYMYGYLFFTRFIIENLVLLCTITYPSILFGIEFLSMGWPGNSVLCRLEC